MSILIRGMEMPKDGSWRSIRIYPDGTIGRPIGFGDYALVDGAKAVPVPPHGRLIDLDAIPKEAWRGEKEDLVDELILAPTIIPAEEVE